MELGPWGSDAPHDYDDTLDEPTELTFDSLVSRIRQFDSLAMLQLATAMSWHAWDNDFGSDSSDHENFLTRAYGSQIACLAMIHGVVAGPRPTEKEFRNLCWEAYSCPLPISDSFWKAAAIEPALTEALVRLEETHPLRRIPVAEYGVVAGLNFMSQIATRQWADVVIGVDDILRCLLVARAYKACMPSELGDRIEAVERLVFGTSYEHFVRALFVILAAASDSRDPTGLPAPFRLSGLNLTDIQNHIAITEDDIRLVARSAARNFRDYADDRLKLSLLPPPVALIASIADLPPSAPLVELSDHAGPGFYALPSPWKLIAHGVHALLNRLPNALVADGVCEKKTAFAGLGKAFAKIYTEGLRPRHGTLIDVDSLDGLKGKRPDALWIGTEFSVVIEAKHAVKPHTDEELLSASSIVETWRRMLGAVEQGEQFVTNYGATHIGNRRRVLVIVTLDPMAEETTKFMAAVKRWSLLGTSNFEAVISMSSSDLEHYLTDLEPDTLAKDVVDVFTKLDAKKANQGSERPRDFSKQRLPHLASVWNDLGFGVEKSTE